MFEGPIATMVAGFLSSLGYMNLWLVYFLVVVADLSSDALYYALGRWGRKKFIEKYGHYVGITKERIEKLEGQFHRHGDKMLIFGKIADPLSSTIQTIAGTSRMNLRKYIFWNVVATLPKSLILVVFGYYFGEAIHSADSYRQILGVAISVLGIIVIGAYLLYRSKKKKEFD
ncbi:MAG: DedA family protein [Candidatus Wolfebacteria bacterium]|nr:DedA family protein [Candidatus Wolfebacteria bacterium]